MKVPADWSCYCVRLFVVISCVLPLKLQVFVSAAPPQDDAATTVNNIQHAAAMPALKHYDIWSADNDENEKSKAYNDVHDAYDDDHDDDGLRKFILNPDDLKIISNNFGSAENWRQNIIGNSFRRQSKVLHLFPVPVDGECLSDDGRRTGTCFNAYECRMKGGMAKGDCAMGFGVCCIFIANCNETITNNITYLISPNFPSFMPDNFTTCQLKVKLMNADISQLRIDFFHFSLGQPNRRTGVCEGDVFNVTGGPGGTISLCGQNSGQHMYYDVESRALPRHQQLYGKLKPLTYDQLYPKRNDSSTHTSKEQHIEIILNFAQRYLPSRLWEIRISQIPFSQRAPAGCLQYYTGLEGILQTFNYADNGRHLANQNYRICMRQETEMCSIMYQPCDDQSFRIGPNEPRRTITGSDNGAMSSPITIATRLSTPASPSTTTTAMTTTSTTTSTTTTTTSTTTTTPTPETTTTEEDVTTTMTSALNDDIEGSGGENFQLFTPSSQLSSRRPRPVSGGFDLLGFLRHALNLRRFGRTLTDNVANEQQQQGQQSSQRQKRQFIRKCTDRITLPCIIEDFIDAGFGQLPGCEPVHCGSRFCASGMNPCRIESTVTPFYIGVHFGDGTGKGSAEDNIGACLRYTQVQCM